MVKEATPSDFEDLIRPLPDYERARNLGPKYFDDSNVSFWNSVKNWERMLQAGEFNTPGPTTLEEEQELLPFKDESFLELWNCRVRISLEKQRLKNLKLQRAKVVKYHQQKNYQRLINSFR
jgi:hypothetical protein